MVRSAVQGGSVSAWWPALLAGCAVAALVALAFGIVRSGFVRYQTRYLARTEHGLDEIFLFLAPRQIWQLTVMTCLVIGAAVALLTHRLELAVLAMVGLARVPHHLIAHLRKRRIAAIEALLPEALRTMAGGLRAGASLPVVLRHLTQHAEVPLRQELALVQREQRVGVPFIQAMNHMDARIDSEAVRLLCASLRVAAQTGGNLSDTIEGVTETIEKRTQMAARVRTLTAQGRLQAAVMGALPLILLGTLTLIMPQDMAPLWETPLGWVVLGVMASMQLCGYWMIRSIVRIDI